MNTDTSLLFWILVVFCISIVIFIWRQPILFSLKGLLGLNKPKATDTLGSLPAGLEIQVPVDALKNNSEKQSEIKAVLGARTTSNTSNGLGRLDKINSKVQEITRKTQVISFQVQTLQTKRRELDEIQLQINQISFQISQISSQISSLQ